MYYLSRWKRSDKSKRVAPSYYQGSDFVVQYLACDTPTPAKWEDWTFVATSKAIPSTLDDNGIAVRQRGLFAAREFAPGDAIGMMTGPCIASVKREAGGAWQAEIKSLPLQIFSSLEAATTHCQSWVDENVASEYVLKAPYMFTDQSWTDDSSGGATSSNRQTQGWYWIDAARSKTGYVQYANCWTPFMRNEANNSKMHPDCVLFATRHIKSGDEILWDYAYVDNWSDKTA